MEQFTLTLALIVLTGLISWQSFNNREMFYKLLFSPTMVRRDKDYFRFLSHGFVHADLGHLLINMLVLYQFGEFVERSFKTLFGPLTGGITYLGFYLSAIVVASIPDYFIHRNNYGYGSVGASGATSALVFSFILFNPWAWFLFPPLPALIFGVLYLIYSQYMSKRGTDNIGHNAHFWGAVYGVIFTLLTFLILRPEMLTYFWIQFRQGPGPMGS
jgi:membrane associated rhomboid family serine protease